MNSQLMEKMSELHLEMGKLEKLVFSNLVSWETLQRWDIGDEKEINGTLNVKLVGEKNLMLFRTLIPNTFPEHFHDFIEHNYIISGQYTDGKRIYNVGDVVKYTINELHKVESIGTEILEILVIFTR
jgi:hypothetical protein